MGEKSQDIQHEEAGKGLTKSMMVEKPMVLGDVITDDSVLKDKVIYVSQIIEIHSFRGMIL